MYKYTHILYVIIEIEFIYKNDILIMIILSNISNQAASSSKNYHVLIESSR